ncbi:MAG: response regulator [Bacteroidetes bacterium]|nr:response regulator [Bacteroidota bacterium]
MANALLIWDNNKSYAEKLSADLGISYPDDVVFSISEFEKNIFLETKDCIVVLLETNIEGEHRTNFKGIEIIKTLRKDKRYKGLIVAYSSYAEEHFRNRKDAKILFTSGTRLRRFTKKGINVTEIENWLSEGDKKVPKLSEDLLDDIHYNVFDTKGIIHELLHRLKNTVNNVYTEKTIAKVIESVSHKFEDYKKQLLREIDSQKISDFNKHFASLVSETKADIEQHWKDKKKADIEQNWKEKENKTIFKYSNAGNQVSKFSNQIADLAPKSNDDAENKQEENIHWEVLFFDDTEGIRKIVSDYFKAKNVVCHLAATEKEVYEKLKENAPRISLFISDIRLEEENGNWFDRQGYDVIEQVKLRSDYPLAYSVLTSKKGAINKRVQKKSKYDIPWFIKDDVISNSSSFSIFFDAVKEYAEENFNDNNIFQPDKGAWNKVSDKSRAFFYPLKSYYKHHKEKHQEYLEAEMKINKHVLDYIESNIKEDNSGLGDLKFSGAIVWTSKLRSSEITEAEVNTFRYIKLLGRRLVLAMIFIDENITPQEIIERLYTIPDEILDSKTSKNKKDRDKTYEDYFSGKIKAVFSTHLALSTQFKIVIETIKEFANGKNKSPKILKEEYDFLSSEFLEEEMSSIESLGNDQDHLTALVEKINNAFDNRTLPKPNSLNRINYILNKGQCPKFKRLDTLFNDIISIDNTNNLLKEITDWSDFNNIDNKELQSLLLRYKLMDI